MSLQRGSGSGSKGAVASTASRSAYIWRTGPTSSSGQTSQATSISASSPMPRPRRRIGRVFVAGVKLRSTSTQSLYSGGRVFRRGVASNHRGCGHVRTGPKPDAWSGSRLTTLRQDRAPASLRRVDPMCSRIHGRPGRWRRVAAACSADETPAVPAASQGGSASAAAVEDRSVAYTTVGAAGTVDQTLDITNYARSAVLLEATLTPVDAHRDPIAGLTAAGVYGAG